jgi:hypothetical protein
MVKVSSANILVKKDTIVLGVTMAKLYRKSGWKPAPGSRVSGQSGKRLVTGTVVPDPDHPYQPKVRAMGWRGCVLLFIKRDSDGQEIGINEVMPAGQPSTEERFRQYKKRMENLVTPEAPYGYNILGNPFATPPIKDKE